MAIGWKDIAEDIARRIAEGEVLPGQRLAPGEDLATEWGVSRHTAHRAVEELQRQGLVVRQRRWGTVVADRKSVSVRRVALMVDRFAPAVNFPPAEMLRGMQDGLGETVDLVVIDSRSDPAVEARRLADLGEVDGLIMVPTAAPQNTARIQRLVDSGLPVVILDRVPEGLRADAVTTDNEGATLAAVRALEAQGHRRIGFFSFHKPGFSSIRERHGAYVAALEEVGLRDHEPYERWFPRELDNESPRMLFQAVADALHALVHGPERITALFCVQDVFAAAVLESSIRLGIDLALATFNDWPAVMLRTPPETLRIVQRTHEIGLTAAQLLIDRLRGDSTEPRLVRVAAELDVPGPVRIHVPMPLTWPMEAISPQ